MDSVSESYRDWLVKAHHTASQDFDRAVMTLAGGGLGISIAFVRDIAPHPVHKWMLAFGLSAFTLSLVCVFISLLTSQATSLRMIEGIDANREPSEQFDVPGWMTDLLNRLAAAFLVLGVGFVVLFALYNL